MFVIGNNEKGAFPDRRNATNFFIDFPDKPITTFESTIKRVMRVGKARGKKNVFRQVPVSNIFKEALHLTNPRAAMVKPIETASSGELTLDIYPPGKAGFLEVFENRSERDAHILVFIASKTTRAGTMTKKSVRASGAGNRREPAGTAYEFSCERGQSGYLIGGATVHDGLSRTASFNIVVDIPFPGWFLARKRVFGSEKLEVDILEVMKRVYAWLRFGTLPDKDRPILWIAGVDPVEVFFLLEMPYAWQPPQEVVKGAVFHHENDCVLEWMRVCKLHFGSPFFRLGFTIGSANA